MASPRMPPAEPRRGRVCSGRGWVQEGLAVAVGEAVGSALGPGLEDLVCSALKCECCLEFNVVPTAEAFYTQE